MNRIIILISISLLLGSAVKSQENNTVKVQWYTFEEALQLQQQAPKKIFIDVYTDWCGWCKKMDKTTFKQQAIAEILNEKYYPVKFDAESDAPVEFMERSFTNPRPGVSRSTHQLTYALLGKKVSYPSFAVLDEENQRLTVLKGYMSEDRLLPILKYLGNNIYKDMKWEEYLSKKNKE